MLRRRFLSTWCMVLSLIIFTGSWAAANETELRKELTLEEAIRLGLAVSSEMKQAQLAVQLAELNLRHAEVNLHATVTPLELQEAQLALENAKVQARLQEARTALEVERLYYEVLKAQATLALRQEAVQRGMQQLEVAHSRHRGGEITDLQLREAEQEVIRAEVAEHQAANALRLALMRLQQKIGIPADVELVLTEQVNFERRVVDITEALQIATERRYEIATARQDVDRAQREVQLADNAYTPQIVLRRAQIELERAEARLAQTIDDIHYEVTRAVFNLEEVETRYYLAQVDLELAQANLDLAQIRYDHGLISLLDVFTAQAALAEAEVKAVAAMYDYNVAWAEYLSAIGLGFDRWPNLLSDEAVENSEAVERSEVISDDSEKAM